MTTALTFNESPFPLSLTKTPFGFVLWNFPKTLVLSAKIRLQKSTVGHGASG